MAITVNGIGNYATINAAIAAAQAGDTVQVGPGTYNENVFIDKAIKLVSTGGREATTIVGSASQPGQGTIEIAAGVNGVTLGDTGQGFKIIGLDGPANIERAAIYLTGSHSDLVVKGNEVVAAGDGALTSEYAAAISNMVIDGNIFSGETFVSANGVPDFTTYGNDQFTVANVPRGVVYFGNSNKTGIQFTNNTVTAVAGGTDPDGQWRGNSLVTIDGTNNTASGNTFDGVNHGTNDIDGAYGLRMRGPGMVITNNSFDTSESGAVFTNNAAVTVNGNAFTYGATDDRILAAAGNDTIDGGLGSDIYDMNAAGASGSIVDLNTGYSFSSVTGNDTLLNIENVKGSAGGDGLFGNAGDNIFEATAGNDTIDGREGNDTFNAAAASSSVTINLSNGTATGAFTASLTSVENATGGSAADTLTGTSGNNILSGNGGADTFTGLAGNDTIKGGEGFDTATFSGAATSYVIAATATVGTFTVTGPDGTDTLTSVEHLTFATGPSVWVVKSAAELTYALDNAGAGDKIKLADGTYAGNFVVDTANVTIESLSGNAADVVLQGGFKTVNGIAPGTTVGEFLKTATGYSGTPAGISVQADGVTIQDITIREYRTGVDLQSNSGLTIDNVVFDENIHGIYKETGSAVVTGFTLTNSSFEDGYQGLIINAPGGVDGGDFSSVILNEVTFTRLLEKGIYVEQLGNAEFSDLHMNDVGTFGRGPSFGGVGQNGAGIDINLKYQAYSNISIHDFDFTNVGASTGTSGVSHVNGGAIHIKARDDGGSYGPNPAQLDGVTISDGTIDGTSTGIRVGEPGKTTVGPTNVVISGVDIENASVGSYDNQTTTIRTITLTGDADTATANPASTGAFHFIALGGDDHLAGGNGADTFEGGAGSDTIVGGAGFDTVVVASELTKAAFTGVADIDPVAPGNQAGWSVDAALQGVDKLSGVEVVVDASGDRFLLVGDGGFSSIQAAVNAAQDGDTILVKSGTYAGNVAIDNKAITILGANEGTNGDAMGRTAESSIVGRVTVTGTKAVTLDGLEIRATSGTSTTGPSNPALNFAGSGTYTVANSVFYNEIVGGNTEARAIGLYTNLSGSVKIDGNLFTGTSTGNFSTAPWQRGIWSDGSASDLDILNNTFLHIRSALNLDGYDNATHEVAGNHFLEAGTGISIGIPKTDAYSSIHDNDFTNIGDDFNFQNITTRSVVLDLTNTSNGSSTSAVIQVLGGKLGDTITGSAGADYITGDGPKKTEGSYLTVGGNDTLNGGAGNDTIDAGGGNDTLNGGTGSDVLDGGAGTDIVIQDGSATLSIVAGKWTVTSGSDVDTLTNVEKVTIGSQTYILVDSQADGGFGSVQDALNAAASGQTILVAPGTYDEDGHGADINRAGLQFDTADITLQGVDASGQPINSTADVVATVRSLFGAGNADTIRISETASGLTINGLAFDEPAGLVSQNNGNDTKSLVGVFADDVTITNSTFATGKASFAIEINGAAVDSYTISNNRIGGPIWILGDAGNGGSDEVISNNVFFGTAATGTQSGIYIMGANVASYSPGTPALPQTITGNVFDDGLPAPLFVRTNNTTNPNGLLTVDYVEAFIDANMAGAGETYAYVIDDLTGEMKLTATSAANVNSDAIIASSLDVLNTYQTTGLTLGSNTPNKRDMISANDTVVVKTVGETTATLYDDNLTIKALDGSDDLSLVLASTSFAGATAGFTGAVHDVTLADYATGLGADVDVTGNALDNKITGNSGDNILIGGGGDDIVDGGKGSDTIQGGANGTAYGDTVVYAGDFANYDIRAAGSGFAVTDKTTNDVDFVTGMEHFSFNGTVVAATAAILVNAGPSITAIKDADDGTTTITVAENAAAGTAIATVTATDPNLAAGDTLSYALVDAQGAAYTGPFTISSTGAITSVGNVLNYEATPSYGFLVKVTDGSGVSTTQSVTVALTNVNEAPTAIAIDSSTVSENDGGALIGALSASGQAPGSISYSVVGDPRFVIKEVGGETYLALATGTELDYEAAAQISVTVKATHASGEFFEKVLTIDVTNVNEAPVGLTLDNTSVNENDPGAVVGELMVTDPEGGTVLYSVDNADFEVVVTGGVALLKLKDSVTLDYETMSQVPINVTITATDNGVPVASTSKQFVITMNDVNEAPIGQTSPSVSIEQGSTEAKLNLSGLVDPEGLAISYTVTALPTGGKVFLNGVAVTANQTLTAIQFAALTYTAPDTAFGNYLLSISSNDGVNTTPVQVGLQVTPAESKTYTGDAGANRLDGAAGDDVVNGLGGNDTLLGGSGVDTLDGGTGMDTMSGGSGDDTYVVDDAGDVVIEGLGKGNDTVRSSVNFSLFGQELETLILTGSAAIDGTGSTGRNTITGNNAANIINGGQNADILDGKGGDDTYYVDNAGDVVIEGLGKGTDTVNASVSFSLFGQELEKLVLIGSKAIDGTGSTGKNTIIGNNYANVINGGANADILDGKGGDDTYFVDNTGDVVIEGLGKGYDTVNASISFSLLGQELEKLVLTSNKVIDGTGSTGINTIIGNNAANVIDGGANADTLEGKGGDDTYVVDNASDVVIEAAGQGYDTVNSSVSFAVGAQSIEKLVLTGNKAINGTGGAGVNTIVGNAYANILDGGVGADILTGGIGKDTFVFSTATGSGNIDKIIDFSMADDTIHLDKSVFSDLSLGTLSAAAFKDISTAAADTDDRILYDRSTGKVFYDADGSGSGAAIHFATLENKALLAAADFLIIA